MARPKKAAKQEEEQQQQEAASTAKIQYVGGATRIVATPDGVSVELQKTAIPQKETTKEKEPVSTGTVQENIGSLMKPKSFTPLLAGRFILDLPEIDPTIIKEVQISQGTGSGGRVFVALYDSVDPSTRDMIELLKTRMKKNMRWNLFGFLDVAEYTSTKMTIRHLNQYGDVIAQTIVKDLSIPSLEISGCSYGALDVSTIVLSFYFKSLELK